MRGLKLSGGFAAFGFVLSFIAGLFSHTSILSILLKALIFAVLFGLLGFGISFVFRTFLSDGSSGEFQGDMSEGLSAAPAQNSALGQKVDITIQDEELQKSESDNHFVVGENHQMLNDSDVKNVSNPAVSDSSPGFVPLRNYETVNNFSGKEAESPVIKASDAVSSKASTESAPIPSQAVPAFSGSGDGELDTLPDMGSFNFGGSDSNSDDDDNDDVPTSSSDSEFVTTASSRKTEEPEVKDAALMAKAISSVLSDENSL